MGFKILFVKNKDWLGPEQVGQQVGQQVGHLFCMWPNWTLSLATHPFFPNIASLGKPDKINKNVETLVKIEF